MDDTFLEQAVSSVPKGSILLIEDIDCAFVREEDEDEDEGLGGGYSLQDRMVTSHLMGRRQRRSAVTLSGLLNILDGVGSEEGKIFFATVSWFLCPLFVVDFILVLRPILLIVWMRRSFVLDALIERWNTNWRQVNKLLRFSIDSIPFNISFPSRLSDLKKKERKRR